MALAAHTTFEGRLQHYILKYFMIIFHCIKNNVLLYMIIILNLYFMLNFRSLRLQIWVWEEDKTIIYHSLATLDTSC